MGAAGNQAWSLLDFSDLLFLVINHWFLPVPSRNFLACVSKKKIEQNGTILPPPVSSTVLSQNFGHTSSQVKKIVSSKNLALEVCDWLFKKSNQ